MRADAVHLDLLDLADVHVVDPGERTQHVAEGLAHRYRQPLAFQILRTLERDIGEGNHPHRRLGLVERDHLDRQALADRLRGGDRGSVAEFLVAAGQQLQHGLRTRAFGEIHVEPFGLVVALVQGDEERRILALELPGEAHRDFFRSLRERRLQRRGRKRDRETCHACDNGTQPQRCRSHGLTSPCPGGLLLAP